MKKFPRLLHVTIEKPGNDEPYFVVLEDGVFGVEESNQPIAIYKLVEVGKVAIAKKFVRSSSHR